MSESIVRSLSTHTYTYTHALTQSRGGERTERYVLLIANYREDPLYPEELNRLLEIQPICIESSPCLPLPPSLLSLTVYNTDSRLQGKAKRQVADR